MDIQNKFINLCSKYNLTIQFDWIEPNPYSRPQIPLKKILKIAWHWTGNPNTTGINNANYFKNLKNTHTTYASPHFVVGLQGELIQCVPLNEEAYTTNQANSYSVGIEDCIPTADGHFNPATLQTMILLGAVLNELCGLNPMNDNIRHYDVTGKVCPKWFVDNAADWIVFKQAIADKMWSVNHRAEPPPVVVPPAVVIEPPKNSEVYEIMANTFKELIIQYGEAAVVGGVEQVIKAQQFGKSLDSGTTFLKLNGYITSDHNPDELMTVAEFGVMERNKLTAIDQLPESGWAAAAMAKAKSSGLLKGDEHGNLLPKKNITREEFAQALSNIGLIK
jgi:N-acetylmuramoyl-L-alanine amidase